MIAAALLTLAASAPPRVATLRCGAADLRLVSQVYAGDDSPRAPATQTLTRRAGTKRFAIVLDRSRRIAVDGRRVQDRFIGGWVCLTGAARAHYVLLSYTCGDECETFRILDERGRAIDRAVPQDGPRRDSLNRRLGIARQMAAGLQMTDVLQ